MVATLITVLIGGIAATLITGMIQWRAKDREFEQGRMKAASDQALVQYTKYLDQEQSLISRVYVLIGACTTAADGVIRVTEKRFRGRQPDDSQVKRIIKNFNTTKAKWDSEVLELEQLMGYYHPKQPEGVTTEQSDVVTAWRKIPDAVRGYFKCADDWYEAHKPNQEPPKPPPDAEEVGNACKKEYGELVKHLSELTSALALSQPHPLEGLETSEQTRAARLPK